MIHCYVSCAAFDHEHYQYVGSVNNRKLANIALEAMRQFGLHGELTRTVADMPLLDNNGSHFYTLSIEDDNEPAPYVGKQGQPVNRRGQPQ